MYCPDCEITFLSPDDAAFDDCPMCNAVTRQKEAPKKKKKKKEE